MSKLLKFFLKNKKILFLAAILGIITFFLFSDFAAADPVAKPPVECQASDIDMCPDCSGWPHSWYHCVVCFVGYLVSLPVRIFFAAFVGVFGLGALIAALLYAILSAIVTWLLSTIMSIGIVPGADNTPEIVEIGWNFSRQFANLFFLLALAFIGLATILRIKEYEAKKALPTLIIIALLINFTPVIVGFIVDMGNIVTNFFIFHAGGINNFWGIIETAWLYIVCSLFHIFARDGVWWESLLEIIGEFIGIIIYGVVLFIFFIMAGFVYLLVGSVFFFRTVFLWILMILSPIAFLSKVFPQGRTTKMVFPDILHWDKWWEKLIQWTIIGIPIGFFLYLSNLIMTSARIHSIFNTSGDPNSLEEGIEAFETQASSTFLLVLHDQFTSLFTTLLAPVLGLVVLVMGMMISFKAAPEGAKGIMRMTTQGGIKKGWGGMKATAGKFKQNYDSAKANKMGLLKATGSALTQTTKETYKDSASRISGWGKKVASGGGFGTGPTPSSGGGTGTGRGGGGGGGADGGADGGGDGGGGGGTGGGGGASPPLGPGSPSPTLDPNEYFDQTADQTQATTPTSPLGPGSPSPTLDPNEYFDQTADQTQPPAPPSASAPAPAAPTPPSTTRKQKLKKAANFWFRPDNYPEHALAGLKLGMGVGQSLFKSLEPIITDQIDKEMGIGKHKKSGGDQKTKNCTICSKEINADEKYCSKCGEEQK